MAGELREELKQGQTFSINEHEEEVLRMVAGEIPWERGAWVNACYEFLEEEYFIAGGELTEKGKDYLCQIST